MILPNYKLPFITNKTLFVIQQEGTPVIAYVVRMFTPVILSQLLCEIVDLDRAEVPAALMVER